MKKRILVIDDEESLRFTFENFLVEAGYDVETSENYEGATALLDKGSFDLIITDIILGDKTGVDLLREIRDRGLGCLVIMVTGFPNLDTASESLRLGAFDYLAKPVNQKTLLHTAAQALRHKELIDENERIRTNLEAVFRSVREGIITVDSDMRVIEMNSNAEAICGFVRNEAIDVQLAALPSGCHKQCMEAITKTLMTHETVELYRLDCRKEDRQRQVVNIAASPLIGYDGEFAGAIMALSDETRIADLETDMGERRHFHTMIGKSEPMQKIYRLIEQVADFPATVLIRGESGTGKELVAEALHFRGGRSSGPLVRVNCASLPENLLESELFGHVRGAFTGAVSDRRGRFELADKGTIFLDEIGDMPLSVQAKLLRVLQEMEFERVGDSRPIKVDVRIVAATNRNLAEKVQRGEFREDLYYRLKVIEVVMPALRQRIEDVPLLVGHFISRFSKKFNKKIRNASAEVMQLFMQHDWPGNVRELEHVLEFACILCRDGLIDAGFLPEDFTGGLPAGQQGSEPSDRRGEVVSAIRKAGGNKAKAARILGISRRTIYRNIEEMDITEAEQQG